MIHKIRTRESIDVDLSFFYTHNTRAYLISSPINYCFQQLYRFTGTNSSSSKIRYIYFFRAQLIDFSPVFHESRLWDLSLVILSSSHTPLLFYVYKWVGEPYRIIFALVTCIVCNLISCLRRHNHRYYGSNETRWCIPIQIYIIRFNFCVENVEIEIVTRVYSIPEAFTTDSYGNVRF